MPKFLIVHDTKYEINHAFRKGSIAYQRGISYGANPFSNSTQSHIDWNYGHELASAGLYWVAPPNNPPNVKVNYYPEDFAIDKFAHLMKERMSDQRAKGKHGWFETDDSMDNVEKLAALAARKLNSGYSENLVDLANYIMMLHFHGGAPADLKEAILASLPA